MPILSCRPTHRIQLWEGYWRKSSCLKESWWNGDWAIFQESFTRLSHDIQHMTENSSQSAQTWNTGPAMFMGINVPQFTQITPPCNIFSDRTNLQAVSGATWTGF